GPGAPAARAPPPRPPAAPPPPPPPRRPSPPPPPPPRDGPPPAERPIRTGPSRPASITARAVPPRSAFRPRVRNDTPRATRSAPYSRISALISSGNGPDLVEVEAGTPIAASVRTPAVRNRAARSPPSSALAA